MIGVTPRIDKAGALMLGLRVQAPASAIKERVMFWLLYNEARGRKENTSAKLFKQEKLWV